ncbi:hypothetical protein [Bacillus swezeyi]|uniref:hypothetical protein n=1 Tax=Bacillus swezeyi TaxID=1925020 RepID=UPI00123BB9EF|nr:hypothetical protein [Bacillus swezeyi]KAA6473761.1 hypothetical protein DX928_20865 [Bacillus swezeyi]
MSEKRSKKKLVIGIVAALVVISVSYSAGSSSASTELGTEKVKYDDMVEKISKKKKELDQLDKKVSELTNKLDENSKKYEEAKEVIANRDEAQNEQEKIKNDIDKKKDELKKIKNDIEDKNDELLSVQGKVKEAKSAPKVLSAGKYTVGEDLPAGRYKAESTGGFGNFIVYNSYGELDVNTILGDGGESQYIFNCEDGAKIELSTSVKFTPLDY